MKFCTDCNRKYLNSESDVCQFCGGYLEKSNTYQCVLILIFSVLIVLICIYEIFCYIL